MTGKAYRLSLEGKLMWKASAILRKWKKISGFFFRQPILRTNPIATEYDQHASITWKENTVLVNSTWMFPSSGWRQSFATWPLSAMFLLESQVDLPQCWWNIPVCNKMMPKSLFVPLAFGWIDLSSLLPCCPHDLHHHQTLGLLQFYGTGTSNQPLSRVGLIAV